MGLIDLHSHTTASDGTFTPSELVRYAKSKGLAALAITDHDTVDGVEEALNEGKKVGIEVIPGIEFSADFGKEIHILGINIDYKSDKLQKITSKLQLERKRRYPITVDMLNKLGVNITTRDVEENSKGGQIGRVHIALALLNKGYVESINEAFDKYLGEGKPAYMPKDVISPEEAIMAIKDAKGLSFLAHPGLLKEGKSEIEKTILKLKEFGLDGVEVYHSDHDDEMTEFLESVARKHNLFITGGSDFHGNVKYCLDLGTGRNNLEIGYEVLEKIKKESLNL